MKVTTSAGTRSLWRVSVSISPFSTIWTILPSIVAPIPGSSFARPARASSATGRGVSRISPAARR